MLIDYARVGTEEQDTALQRDALTGAGCERIFEEMLLRLSACEPFQVGQTTWLPLRRSGKV